MIVLTITDCPPRLRGDLSKWLCEIQTGVYVGQLTGRVREAVWKRVCDNLSSGRATMVYSSNGEQHMKFVVHNTTWEPVDFDGITLMRRPLPRKSSDEASEENKRLQPGFSKAALIEKVKRIEASKGKQQDTCGFITIDIETTGLDPEKDEILEIAAIKYIENNEAEVFSRAVKVQKPLTKEISELTGITDDFLLKNGMDIETALKDFWDFVGRAKLVGYNISFDMSFLRNASIEHKIKMQANKCIDILQLARRKVKGTKNYKMSTVASTLGIEMVQKHRAESDCRLAFEIYRKLNEN